MEKVKTFLFYHGEKVGLAAVVLVCLLGLLAAQPWSTTIPEVEQLNQGFNQLKGALAKAESDTEPPAHADFVARLETQLGPVGDVQPFESAVWPTHDIDALQGERQNYPRVASVEDLKVVPERGRLKVTWSVDPEKQAIENTRARYSGVIELVRAVVYRAPAEAPDRLQEVGATALADVVIVPATAGTPRRDRLGGFTREVARRPRETALYVAEGKITSEEAERAGRFVFADSTVKPERDWVYTVKLVAKNPVYLPQDPNSPEFTESDLEATPLSLAQRSLPSLRWFFTGGSPDWATVRVYKWHVFTISASELAGAGGKVAETEAGAAGDQMVERAGWVDAMFSVRPGDPIGSEDLRWFRAPGTEKLQQLTIDFSTGCTAVAVGSAVQITDYPAVTLTAAGAPATRRHFKDTLLLYYTDPAGNLRTRWQESDQLLGGMVAGVEPGEGPKARRGPEGREGTPASREQFLQRRREMMREDEERSREARERARASQLEDEAHRRERQREARYEDF